MSQCNCNRDGNLIIHVTAKCSDMFHATYYPCLQDDVGKDVEGYVPKQLQIGSGDYIDFEYCRACGTIVSGKFPIKDEVIEELFEFNEEMFDEEISNHT